MTRIALATALDASLRHYITDVDAAVELVADDSLLPPQRFPGDHDGDPLFARTERQQAAFEALLGDADVLYGIPDVNPTLLRRVVEGNPRVRWVQTMAAGGGSQVKAAGLSDTDLTRVTFTTSAGVHGTTLAEFALFGVLAGAKDLPLLQSHQRAHRWAGRWAMRQVHEMTVLVVGLGGIGTEVARLLSAVGATVIGVKRHPEPAEHVDEVHPLSELASLLPLVDAIVFTLPGTAETEGLYGSELMSLTKPGAIIVNLGRGSVIQEGPLVEALTAGRLHSAYLDVTEIEPLPASSPLWELPQVVIAPHTAALSPLEDERIARLFAENLRRFLDGRPLLNVVDTVNFY